MRTECRNVVGYALVRNKHLWFFSLKQSRKYLSPHTLSCCEKERYEVALFLDTCNIA